MPQKITENTLLIEIFNNPKNLKILAKYNLPCLTCPFARFEIEKLTLGEVCRMYKIDLQKLLKELNQE